jgi:hypothetical protein
MTPGVHFVEQKESMDTIEDELDYFFETTEVMVKALFPDRRHQVCVSFFAELKGGENSYPEFFECYQKHFSGCKTVEDVGAIMYKTVVAIGGVRISSIYAVAKGSEKSRELSDLPPPCPISSTTLLRAFLLVCYRGAKKEPKRILRAMLGIEETEQEETPMQRLAARMSSTVTGVEKELVTALLGEQDKLPQGMGYSRKHLKKTKEVTDGIATIKEQLDDWAITGDEDSDT